MFIKVAAEIALVRPSSAHAKLHAIGMLAMQILCENWNAITRLHACSQIPQN